MFDFNYSDYLHVGFQVYQTKVDNGFSLLLKQVFPASKEKNWVPYYHFYMRYQGKSVGYINFRLSRSPQLTEYFGHLGYRVDEMFRGCGFSGRAVTMLLPFIRAHGYKTILITCSPDNLASVRVLEKLDAQYLGLKTFHGLDPEYDSQKAIYQLPTR